MMRVCGPLRHDAVPRGACGGNRRLPKLCAARQTREPPEHATREGKEAVMWLGEHKTDTSLHKYDTGIGGDDPDKNKKKVKKTKKRVQNQTFAQSMLM